MPRDTTPPVVTTEPFGQTEHDKITHPAFGCVTVVRPQGAISLHGSEFEHRSYVSIRVKYAVNYRSLSHTVMHPGADIVEIAMSESQWARLLSSIGDGNGVPCTLEFIKGVGRIPGLPRPDPPEERYKLEANEHIKNAIAQLRQLVEDIDALKVSQRSKDALVTRVQSAAMEIMDGVPFVADQFSAHVERTLDAARTEIAAFAQRTIGDTERVMLPQYRKVD